MDSAGGGCWLVKAKPDIHASLNKAHKKPCANIMLGTYTF